MTLYVRRPFASVGLRVAAMAVDAALLVLFALLWDGAVADPRDPAALAVLGAVLLGYKPLCEWLFGATPGKALLGLRVRTARAMRLSIGAVLLRNLPYLIVMAMIGTQVALPDAQVSEALRVAEGPAMVLAGALLGRARLDFDGRACWDRAAGAVCVARRR